MSTISRTSWTKPDGRILLTHAEVSHRADEAEHRAVAADRRAERLAARLRALGLDPEDPAGS